MKLVSGSFLVALISTAAWAAAPEPAAAPAPAAAVQKVPAPSAERLDLAHKFVSLSLSADQFLKSVRMVSMQFAADPDDGTDKNPEATVDHALAKLEPAMRSQLPKLFEAYAQAYAREFSADELRDMIAFAGTPGGRHYLMHRDFVFADPSVIQAQEDMNEAMKPALYELQKEACAKKAAARIAAGDKKATCPLAKAAQTQAG